MMSTTEAFVESRSAFYANMSLKLKEIQSSLKRTEERLLEVSDDLFRFFTRNTKDTDVEVLEAALDAAIQFEITKKKCINYNTALSENSYNLIT
ncbi:hypothetical protein KSF78_0006782 [Schistosoma japonicum]|nr:hypothetical protein KSF78_0006782 [Schistosoma japonicum]